MAIFASTTTSGYSDPLKAQSIKALEQRQKDLLAQQAQQTMPESMPSPFQVGGHVLNQLASGMQQNRTDQAIAAQREVLARAMTGYDPMGDAPPPSIIASVAPDQYKDMMQTWAQNRLAKQAQAASAKEHELTRTHSSTEAGLTRTQQKELAEASDRRARELQQEKLTAEERMKQKELDAAAAVRAADPKRAEAVEASETNYRKGLSHIENLEEAKKILAHPGGIYTGAAQSAAPVIGGIPGVGGMLVDKEKAQRTSRYNTIVGEDAIRDMASTLKGSSTNFELQKFEKMKNDPNISDKQREDQLEKVVKAARADLEAMAKTAKAIGGDTERVDRAMRDSKATVADPAADPAAAAQAAINAGAPFDAVAERFKSKGGDPSVLKPKGP